MKPHLVLPVAFAAALAGCPSPKQTDVQEIERKNAELQARLVEQESSAKTKAAEDLAA
jgi:hypothetical protein